MKILFLAIKAFFLLRRLEKMGYDLSASRVFYPHVGLYGWYGFISKDDKNIIIQYQTIPKSLYELIAKAYKQTKKGENKNG